mmetsp:Transcript_33672/g.81404  ORF Transcript_33672/g.81404 Transcript_33672/m.81404 type:complete len:222 (-) Transcript_33672:142-807(-)
MAPHLRGYPSHAKDVIARIVARLELHEPGRGGGYRHVVPLKIRHAQYAPLVAVVVVAVSFAIIPRELEERVQELLLRLAVVYRPDVEPEPPQQLRIVPYALGRGEEDDDLVPRVILQKGVQHEETMLLVHGHEAVLVAVVPPGDVYRRRDGRRMLDDRELILKFGRGGRRRHHLPRRGIAPPPPWLPTAFFPILEIRDCGHDDLPRRWIASPRLPIAFPPQ